MSSSNSRKTAITGDIAGNVLPIAASGMLVAAALIGGAVDMGRAYMVKNRLQAACDAAVLAGRRGVSANGFDDGAREQASSYFAVDFDAAAFGAKNSSFTTSSAESSNTIIGTASASIDTTVMRIFGRQDFQLAANCKATMGVGNSDITMVLDTTGSMDWTLPNSTETRIQALRAAMKNFYSTMQTVTASSNARIRYAFVPYSSSVNVGRLLYDKNPAWLVDSWRVQSRAAVYRQQTSYTYDRWGNVTGSTTSQVFDRFDYKPVTYDVSGYKTFIAASTNTGANGAAVSSTWAGCIEERASTPASSFSFSSLNGISPSAADLDIDTAPSGADATKWAPMWPEVAYYRLNYNGYLNNSSPSVYGGQAPSFCPRESRLLATMTQSDFNAYADGLRAEGGTYHDIGMIWGARISSPDGIFASTVNEVPSNGGNLSRHIIFMTDGEMSTNYDIQTSYGIEYHDRRVTDDGYSYSNERHTSRFLALCEAVKAKGIRLWVIAFGASLTTDLQTCSSSGSSFTAGNASQLNSAFQEIAKQVGELRVVQ